MQKNHLSRFLALQDSESLANQQINSFLNKHLSLDITSFSIQQINVKKSPIDFFLHINLFLTSTCFSNQQINTKINSHFEFFGFEKCRK